MSKIKDIRLSQSIEYNGEEYSVLIFSQADIIDYKALRDMYYGTGGFKDGSYLIRHPREDFDFYESRQKLAHYENAFAPELLASITPVFAKPQYRVVDGKSKDIVEKYISNPTKRNEDLSEYMNRLEIDTKLYGSTFVVTDAPTEVPLNGADDGDPKYMPYTYHLTPTNIVGYNLDENGALSMLVYAEDTHYRDQYDNLSQTISADIVYRVWMKDNYNNNVTFQYVDGAVNLDSIVTLPYLPVILREDNTREDEAYICKSRYISMFSLAKKMYNLDSQVDDGYFKNCFAFLAVHGMLPEDVDLGNDSAFNYMGEGVNIPSYVAPPTDHLDSMNSKVDTHRKNLKEDMNSTVIISSEASAESRQSADKRRIEMLKKTAKNLEQLEYWIIDKALRLYISTNYNVNIQYIDDFESLTKNDSLNTLQALVDSGAVSQGVIQEIGVDMIKLVYSSEPTRRDVLVNLQRSTNAFEDETLLIADEDVIDIEG